MSVSRKGSERIAQVALKLDYIGWGSAGHDKVAGRTDRLQGRQGGLDLRGECAPKPIST